MVKLGKPCYIWNEAWSNSYTKLDELDILMNLLIITLMIPFEI